MPEFLPEALKNPGAGREMPEFLPEAQDTDNGKFASRVIPYYSAANANQLTPNDIS